MLKKIAAKVHLVVFVILLLLTRLAAAGEISLEKATIAAQNWIYGMKSHAGSDLKSGNLHTITEIEPIYYNDTLVGYNFLLHPTGHVIVPVRDELPPVKLYSFTSNFSFSTKRQEADWISKELYDRNNFFSARDYGVTKPLSGDQQHPSNGQLWDLFGGDTASFPKRYLDFSTSRRKNMKVSSLMSTASTSDQCWLLSTTWDQFVPYNWNAPQLFAPSGGYPAGCVATAAAQVMNYWGYPLVGHGSTSYIWDLITLSRDFSQSAYNWGLMLDHYGSYTPQSGPMQYQSYTTEQGAAVAQLIGDVGVAYHMNYGPNGSEAYLTCALFQTPCSADVFRNYFGYSNSIKEVGRADIFCTTTPDNEWMDFLGSEVLAGRPALLSIRDPNLGGHTVVVDGYQSTPSTQIHLNMGWSGSYDGWYVSDNISGPDFNFSDLCFQASVVGIQPPGGQPVCRYTVSPQVINNVPLSGGSGNLTVTATPHICATNAISNVGWITTSPGVVTCDGAMGNIVIGYSVSANKGIARKGTVTIGGQAVTISQIGIESILPILNLLLNDTPVIAAAVSGGQGTVSCTPIINQGDPSACSIIPNSGYYLSSLTDNGSDVTSQVSNGAYTISDVTVDHTIGAAFAEYPVKMILGESYTYYLTIQAAFVASSSSEEIDILQAHAFAENLIFNSGVAATLKGGYLSDFLGRSGYTAVRGSLMISTGSLIVENLIIQ